MKHTWLVLACIACQERAPPTPAPVAQAPARDARVIDAALDASPDAEVDPYAVMHEPLGELTHLMPAAEALKLRGAPRKRTKPIVEGYSGYWVSDWSWPDGLTLGVFAETERGPWIVKHLAIRAPSTLRTARGIGIGSSRTDVVRLYGKDLSNEREPETELVAGSIYGGIVFTLDGDRVTEIFIGASAV